MTSLLVTNDFPPKTGGIQTYLWELWRRLPPEHAMVLAPFRTSGDEFDAAQPFRIERTSRRVLLPTPSVARWIRTQAVEANASLVVLDPVLPLGRVGLRLGMPYAVVVHGAELTVAARLPLSRNLLEPILKGARLIVAAGAYPASEADRVTGGTVPVVVVPPGIDPRASSPPSADRRDDARRALGLPEGAQVVASVSRLVPRKGLDVLVAAASLMARERPQVRLVIAGEGRDRRRLERLARYCRSPVTFLGWVTDQERARLLDAADVFAMPCRNRWRGLEQEGFGIVFLEAAAIGLPQVAGSSGGAADAVVDGLTGAVVARPDDPADVASAIRRLLADDGSRRAQGEASRRRAEAELSYDRLAAKLAAALTAAAPIAAASAGPRLDGPRLDGPARADGDA